MAYCVPLGIPHSVFLEWSNEDREKALQYEDLKAQACSYCGTIPEDWLDERGRDLEPPPYQVVSRYCPGCAMLDDEREHFEPNRRRHIRLHLVRVTRERSSVRRERRRQRRTEG